jgi:hypothetical protein
MDICAFSGGAEKLQKALFLPSQALGKISAMTSSLSVFSAVSSAVRALRRITADQDATSYD